MRISAVVAMSENRVIGQGNRLPWKLSQDLKRFRSITLGHPILMGRKTFESIGRVLPGRENLIISRQPGFHVEGARVVRTLEEAFETCRGKDELFIVGGAEIYQLALKQIQRLYLTLIHQRIEGDTFFPDFSCEDFQETHREEHEENGYSYSFMILDRRQ